MYFRFGLQTRFYTTQPSSGERFSIKYETTGLLRVATEKVYLMHNIYCFGTVLNH